MGNYNYSDELTHYGVKGMKWGVRRAQKAVQKYGQMAKRQASANYKVANAAKKMLNSGYNSQTGKRLTSTDRQRISREYATYASAGKKWIETHKDIMNMNISIVTPRDVKNRYKNTNAGGVYVY